LIGAGTHADDLAALGDQGLEFGLGGFGIDQGHHAGDEQAVVHVPAPLFVDPTVERANAGHGRTGVLPEHLLEAECLGRQHDAEVDALLVEDAHPRLAVTKGAVQRDLLPHDFAQRPAFGVVALEVLDHRAWRGDGVVRGDGNELVEPVVKHQHPSSVDVDPAKARAIRGIEVLGDRVGRFVEVLIGIGDSVSYQGVHDQLVRSHRHGKRLLHSALNQQPYIIWYGLL
jgi:hypothetical protein